MRYPARTEAVRLFLTIFLLIVGPSLQGAQILINFEGLNDGEFANGFYDLANGGTGSQGSLGLAFGVTILDGLAFSDFDEGGTGNFANEPSPVTILTTIGNPIVMTVLSGFKNVMSFWYVTTATSTPGLVTIFDSQGNVLAERILEVPTSNCAGDPNGGIFGCWQQVTLQFSGLAASAWFIGDANAFGIDSILLDLDTNDIVSNIDQDGTIISDVSEATPGANPEPSTLAMITGAGLVLAAMRVRRRA